MACSVCTDKESCVEAHWSLFPFLLLYPTCLDNWRERERDNYNLKEVLFYFIKEISFPYFSVDEILLPRYMKWYTNFRGLFNVQLAPIPLKHMDVYFIRVHVETNVSCPFQAMQQILRLC